MWLSLTNAEPHTNRQSKLTIKGKTGRSQEIHPSSLAALSGRKNLRLRILEGDGGEKEPGPLIRFDRYLAWQHANAVCGVGGVQLGLGVPEKAVVLCDRSLRDPLATGQPTGARVTFSLERVWVAVPAQPGKETVGRAI